jgi:Cd2+/Zn2+-exporting ATPase/Cu+-exporting ATPase
VEREGVEHEVPVGEIRVGEIVVVRPGEKIPVDGEVVGGRATVDQSAITGEAVPAEIGQGSRVFAATIAQNGGLRVCATGIGADTTFGRVVKMVEEAEAHRGDIQRLADRFSAYYLPLVAGLGVLTLLIGRNPLAAAAVLVVACSCSIALATPIAVLASIGAAARRGLLIKGGRTLEALARADVLLIDKTGTLTFRRLQVSDVVPLNGLRSEDVLVLAASAERYSEHPLAEAVRRAALARGLALVEAEDFEALPGLGVRARIAGRTVRAGSARMVPGAAAMTVGAELEGRGKTLLYVERDGEVCGAVAVADVLRPEVPAALDRVRALGVTRIELLTGDNERAASTRAGALGLDYRASLLPEDKIAAVRELQAEGHVVIMVGDGVNDAPALAQADVGIAMGAAGSDIAIEAAHVALLRDDWNLVPVALKIARRTMRVVKMNLVFTGIYNLTGIALAALGLLPPILAAAAQSLPDLGILGNSARLLRQNAGAGGGEG